MLLYFQRCHRRTFLDTYGDLTQKDPLSDFHLRLQQERFAHQQAVLQAQIEQGATLHQKPVYPSQDWQAGAEATQEMMRQGVERIYRGVLTAEVDSDGKLVTLVSAPDLLVKQPGKSYFGDWVYVPIDIHLGKRPKLEYQIVAAYHAYLLSFVQGISSEKAWLILRGKGWYLVNLERSLPQMQEALQASLAMLVHGREPEVFISRQICNLCPWFSSCYQIAKSQEHLSLIPGVSPTRYQSLQKLGLNTAEAIANSDPAQLALEIGLDTAQQLVNQAKSLTNNCAIPRQPHFPANYLPNSPIEIYFDIEAEPDLNLDYLLGVLVVNQEEETQTFHPFFAEKPTDEGSIWEQFIDLVSSYPKAPIFHFSPYEAETVKRLAKLYQTPKGQTRALLARFVDLHKRLHSAVTLPVESYSLKSIARWMGFHWRYPQANGSLCICWYNNWLETGSSSWLDLIVAYNEDDCLATYQIKEWLAGFLQETM
ncbi:TM0106 family RecB-like putative nuclease [Merismopedia glauca]|nr:TM0106 family RecB-like putative nuclease [Merismopedia glauca]